MCVMVVVRTCGQARAYLWHGKIEVRELLLHLVEGGGVHMDSSLHPVLHVQEDAVEQLRIPVDLVRVRPLVAG